MAYIMNHARRGRADIILIHHYLHEDGTVESSTPEIDINTRNICHQIAEKLRFEPVFHSDITKHQFNNLLDTIRNDPKQVDSDAYLMIISAHGFYDGRILFYDGGKYVEEDFISWYSAQLFSKD
jgi:hypothetical protein